MIRSEQTADQELVLSRARELDQIPENQRGPLHGMAIGIKDVMNTKGLKVQSFACQMLTSPRHAHPVWLTDIQGTPIWLRLICCCHSAICRSFNLRSVNAPFLGMMSDASHRQDNDNRIHSTKFRTSDHQSPRLISNPRRLVMRVRCCSSRYANSACLGRADRRKRHPTSSLLWDIRYEAYTQRHPNLGAKDRLIYIRYYRLLCSQHSGSAVTSRCLLTP